MELKVLAEILQEVGAGNTALIVILGLFAWFFTKVLPKAVERLVAAIENLGTTFAVHDVRASAISQSLIGIETNIYNLNKNVANQENIVRLHDRLDIHFSNSATKEDIKLIIDAVADHARDCQVRNNQLQRDVIGGR